MILLNWPRPYDQPAADRLIERFGGIDSAFGPLLRCLGGNSPYLSDLVLREPETFVSVLRNGVNAAFSDCMSRLARVPPDAARPDVAAALRKAKREVALITAIADIGGIWPLESVTGALSELAEVTLRLAIRHLLRAAHGKGMVRLSDPGDPEHDCGFTVIGMGKLGAAELNYSSDIDLILLYEADARVYAEGRAADSVGTFTSRLARDLVGLMETRDANGYVFRTDLRLRPDPAATPPAVSLLAALTYYESMGQNWERAAMIKARPIAGDIALGHRFLEAIRPFIWRRGLDFAAVADIHAMKQRINVVRNAALGRSGSPVTRIAGHNVKLGEGGIREIEFLVQTLQMVWGGRDPTLRQKSTLQAARRLAEAGHLAADTCERLTESYRFLRQVEHRIQMVNDRQTHDLPDSLDGMARIAAFMGYPDASSFATVFLGHIEAVRADYLAVFEHIPEPPEPAAAGPALDFNGDDPEPAATVAALAAMGFTDHRHVINGVRHWLAGHVRALRSSRARDLMSVMLPAVLSALGRQSNPDEAFNRFDRFIAALPAGVQLMSLFQCNPALLERVAAVLGAAPLLSEHLARYPSALEGLLAGESSMDVHRMLQSRLADATRLEEVIQIVRRSVKERDFLISVATLEGRLDANAGGRDRTALAQAALMVLLPRVLDDFAQRYGRVPGGGLVVVALGKAGGREMMAGSDLDLMFIYDHPVHVTESHGRRALPVSQWYVRAVQACISALTSPGPEGQMYALDMRLRPSGNKGPLAVSLSAFERYHREDAWTWERMALTRARVVAGPPSLRFKVKAAIRDALCRPRDTIAIRSDAAAMRSRMARELRPQGPWDAKLRAGGLVDIEFIAQVGQLIQSPAGCFDFNQTTRVALRRLADVGALNGGDADLLIHAEYVWRTIQGMLRLTVGPTANKVLPSASAEPLLRVAAAAGIDSVDTHDLLHNSDILAKQVRQLFERYVGITD